MKKLSEIIYEKEFKPAKAGGFFGGDAGYDPTRVELFLDEIGPMAERLEKENEAMSKRIQQLEEELEFRNATSSIENEESTEEKLESFEKTVSQDEDLKRRMRQIETIERSYKKILFMAEEEAEEIRGVAKDEAKKLLLETQQKADLLLKQVNMRCEEKERQYQETKVKDELVKKDLYKIAEDILSYAKGTGNPV